MIFALYNTMDPRECICGQPNGWVYHSRPFARVQFLKSFLFMHAQMILCGPPLASKKNKNKKIMGATKNFLFIRIKQMIFNF